MDLHHFQKYKIWKSYIGKILNISEILIKSKNNFFMIFLLNMRKKQNKQALLQYFFTQCNLDYFNYNFILISV